MGDFPIIHDPDLRELLTFVGHSKTEFTKRLKEYYKKVGGDSLYNVSVSPADARTVFSYGLSEIEAGRISGDRGYNLARIVKIVLNWDLLQIFLSIAKDAYAYIVENYTHTDGNIRNEVYHFFREYLFLIDISVGYKALKKPTKKQEENAHLLIPPIISFHKDLVWKEREYVTTHYDALDPDDTHDRGFIPYSADTHDKILKNIRRMLEAIDSPGMIDHFGDYGYFPFGKTDGDERKEAPTLSIPSMCDIESIDPIQFESTLRFFLLMSGIPTTLEEVKKKIYEGHDHGMAASRMYHEWIFSLLEKRGMDLSEEILEVFTTAWNIFPHKSLGGTSPQEKAQEFYVGR